MLMNSTKRLPVTQCDANEFNEKITSDNYDTNSQLRQQDANPPYSWLM